MAVRVVALAVLVLLANGLAARAEIFVSGTGYSSLDNGLTRTPWDIVETVTSDGLIVTGSGFSSVGPTGPGLALTQAGGTGLAFATQGRIGASINTAADLINAGPGDILPQTAASFSARFTDTFEVKSSTLGFGTPTTVVYTLAISGVTNSPPPSPGFGGAPTGTVGVSMTGTGFFLAPLRWPSTFSSFVPDELNIAPQFLINTTVGAVLSIDVALSLGSLNRAGGGQGGTQETFMDFTNTVRFFADPSTPDFFLASASGFDYSTNAVAAVPLPSNLLSAALIGLTALIGRQVRRRSGGTP